MISRLEPEWLLVGWNRTAGERCPSPRRTAVRSECDVCRDFEHPGVRASGRCWLNDGDEARLNDLGLGFGLELVATGPFWRHLFVVSSAVTSSFDVY